MNKNNFSGNIVDVMNERIFSGTIRVENGIIASIAEEKTTSSHYIIPGFVDSHIHIESSMLPPAEFARIASQHGTVAVVSDPHEIANVLGLEGIRFMIENANSVPVKFYFSAPSCVPATKFETAGSRIASEDIEALFKQYPQIKYLGEMMNFPGVINNDPDVMNKINIAKAHNKKMDGHSPGLSGEDLCKYVKAGISTDHECFTQEEALEKLSLGMKIQIREGSAAKNFDDLIDLANEHYQHCMFCSDDKHPDDLLQSHINELVKKAVAKGIDIMKVLRIACVNPVEHYGLDVGLLQKGDPADFLLVDSLEEFNIIKTVVDGRVIHKNGRIAFPRKRYDMLNNFKVYSKSERDFYLETNYAKTPVIEAVDGQLVTRKQEFDIFSENHNLISDPNRDILKIAVVNRYMNRKPAIAFIKNFGLKSGAIASSVAHDSHNIIAVGVSETDMCKAVNMIIQKQGGIAVSCEEEDISEILPLPIAGLMSNKPYKLVSHTYSRLDALAKQLGSKLTSPFMTLSFMALLVIPEIKLSDKGLFDSHTFDFISS